MNKPKRILIAPLNWGLGHAARCIPIIKMLCSLGIEPVLASDGNALILLQKEFPTLKSYTLPAYDINYKTENMVLNMATQLPKIVRAIFKEQKTIEQIVKKETIDIILSDNRYGCKSIYCYNVFITHQLNIKIPFASLEKTVSFFNYKMIGQFDTCWVPDFPQEPSLGGILSRNDHFKKVEYIGPLSRLSNYKIARKYDLIVILSGPEPQRTFLEQLVLHQASQLALKILLVQGITSSDKKRTINDHLEIIPYLTSKDLNNAILSASIVLCRSGYSSIMDLVRLGKPAILIPTPGQTEQEYLAERFFEKGIFYTQNQNKFNLKKALEKVKDYKSFDPGKQPDLLKKVIHKLILL